MVSLVSCGHRKYPHCSYFLFESAHPRVLPEVRFWLNFCGAGPYAAVPASEEWTDLLVPRAR